MTTPLRAHILMNLVPKEYSNLSSNTWLLMEHNTRAVTLERLQRTIRRLWKLERDKEGPKGKEDAHFLKKFKGHLQPVAMCEDRFIYRQLYGIRYRYRYPGTVYIQYLQYMLSFDPLILSRSNLHSRVFLSSRAFKS